MNRKILFALSAFILAGLACSLTSGGSNRVVGSGKITSEQRNVESFTSVELAGSADVNVLLGDKESVNVQADDNILPLIETKVVNGKLIVSTRPNTDITSTNGVVVTVVVKSLQGVTLSGSGNLHVAAMSGSDLIVELTGSGDITVEGSVEHAAISMSGSGNILCNDLKTHSADVRLLGSGNITVYADQSLNASLSGSGTIRYEGSPSQVTKSITGSGAITP